MKTLSTLLTVLSIGCAQPLIGDGDFVDEERDLADFDGVETYGVNVEVRAGKAWSFTVSTDENLLSHIHTEVIDGVLRIDTDTEIYPSSLSAVVVTPILTMVGNHDGADLRAVDIDANRLEVMASSEGHTELAGRVGMLVVSSTGSGVRNAADLIAADVEISSTGSGVAWLTATETIEGELSSAVTLNVFGDPRRKAVVAYDASEVIYY